MSEIFLHFENHRNTLVLKIVAPNCDCYTSLHHKLSLKRSSASPPTKIYVLNAKKSFPVRPQHDMLLVG